jgi:hypothetical protein
MATRGPTGLNPDDFGLDDVITLAIALQPTIMKLLEVARQQEEARQRVRRQKWLREHPETRGHGYFQ